jgi:uncharacterized protein
VPRAATAIGVLWITLAGRVCDAGENLFKALAEAGAPVTAVEAMGSAFGSGRPGLAKTLLAAGISERWSDEASALASPPDADPRLVRLLIKAAGDANARYDNGDTVLIRAVRQGLEEAVELLLDKGADVQLPDARGHTPLWHARRADNPEIVKMLEVVGADRVELARRRYMRQR